jgi:ribosomal protein S2
MKIKKSYYQSSNLKISKNKEKKKQGVESLFQPIHKNKEEEKNHDKESYEQIISGYLYKLELIKLKLIQSEIYNKTQKKNNIKIEDIEYRLKKPLQIIYKYHLFKKRILFVGTPLYIMDQKLKELLKNHFIIPESIWLNGVITNKISFFKHIKKHNKKYKITKNLNIDLIVLLNEPSNINVLNESYLSRIPVISLNSDLNIQNNQPSYKIPGNFQCSNDKTPENVFYLILFAILKKADNALKNIDWLTIAILYRIKQKDIKRKLNKKKRSDRMRWESIDRWEKLTWDKQGRLITKKKNV